MIGRMSSAQMHQGSLNVIFDAQARLQKTQEALATGKRVNSAADDPVAAAQITAARGSQFNGLSLNTRITCNNLYHSECNLCGYGPNASLRRSCNDFIFICDNDDRC